MLVWLRRSVERELTRLRLHGRGAVLWSLRITAAATASYVVALVLFPDTKPLLAPLTAMLVVQVTPVSLLASGLDRVIAVVAGVALAVVFSAVVPLQWWSLGVLIFLAITLGQVLRLQANLIEVAISAMLVLGVGTLGAESAAWQRITETLVGAAVGVGANLLFPPKVAAADAGDAIDGLADRLSALLHRAAAEMSDLVAHGRDLATVAPLWLDEAREITHDIPQVTQALQRAEEGRRFNVRAVATADLGPGLRQGLESLEHSAVALRVLFRSLLDAVRDDDWLETARFTTEDVFAGVAQTLDELAAGVDAFGQLVHDEADPTVRLGAADAEALLVALEGMHEARARLENSLVAGGPGPLLELHAAVLGAVKRLQLELDLDERVRRQVRDSRRPGLAVRTDVVAPPQSLPDPDAVTQPLRMPPRAKRRD